MEKDGPEQGQEHGPRLPSLSLGGPALPPAPGTGGVEAGQAASGHRRWAGGP